MLSGTTAVASSTRFVMFPLLKLNKAVFLTGTYRVAPENTRDLDAIVSPDLETVFSRDMDQIVDDSKYSFGHILLRKKRLPARMWTSIQ